MLVEVKLNRGIKIIGNNTKLKVGRTDVEIGHKLVDVFQGFRKIILSYPNGTVYDENDVG